jgi:hypothetical protein
MYSTTAENEERDIEIPVYNEKNCRIIEPSLKDELEISRERYNCTRNSDQNLTFRFRRDKVVRKTYSQ